MKERRKVIEEWEKRSRLEKVRILKLKLQAKRNDKGEEMVGEKEIREKQIITEKREKRSKLGRYEGEIRENIEKLEEIET